MSNIITQESKKNALSLLIETYKLYAAFCAIFIAGLLSYVSNLGSVNYLLAFYISIVSLTICSVLCVFGLQYFINQAHHDRCDIHSLLAKIVIIAVMISLTIGVFSGAFFVFGQDKMNIFNQKRLETKQKDSESMETNSNLTKPPQ